MAQSEFMVQRWKPEKSTFKFLSFVYVMYVMYVLVSTGVHVP